MNQRCKDQSREGRQEVILDRSLCFESANLRIIDRQAESHGAE